MQSKAERPFAGAILPLHSDVGEKCGTAAGHSQWTAQSSEHLTSFCFPLETVLLGHGLGSPKAKHGKS